MGFKARTTQGPAKWNRLTPMQQEVALRLMRGDMTRDDIAEDLGIGVKTVDSHRLTLLKSLNLSSNVQLCLFGIRSGLVKVK